MLSAVSFLRRTAAGLALVTTQLAFAQVSVAVVSAERSGVYAEAYAGMLEVLARRDGIPATVAHFDVSQLSRAQEASARVYVAFGAEAAAALAARDLKAPLLAALLPRSSFEHIVQDGKRRVSQRLTALYLNQPVGRQLSLIRLALPDARRVGVLLGPESSAQKAELEKEARDRKLQLRVASVEDNAVVASRLNEIINEVDTLLVLADRTVYNANTIPNIFLAAFRARVPIVAFSPAYVRAGALLALYSTPNQIGRQAAEMVLAVLDGKPVPEPRYPNEYHVEFNASVARAFEVRLPQTGLEERLRRMGE